MVSINYNYSITLLTVYITVFINNEIISMI